MSQPKKAPKGRIRGEAPMVSGDPSYDARKCTASSSRTGQPCRRWAIAGGRVCIMHGGAAPQVKAKALDRLMALQHPAIDTLAYLMEQKSAFPSTAYAAARDVLDRTEGKAIERVEQDVRLSGDALLIARLESARRRTGG